MRKTLLVVSMTVLILSTMFVNAYADTGNTDFFDHEFERNAWSVEKNIINGTGVGLEPQKVATRAQTAKMLYYSRYYFSFGRPCNE